MKRLILSIHTAVLLLLMILFNPAFAYDDPTNQKDGITFGGKINVSVQRDHDFNTSPDTTKNNVTSQDALHSNASRVGSTGKYSFTPDLSVLYKGELELDANQPYTSPHNNFIERREVYAGINSKTFGTILGGKIDTPLKMLQSKVDMFSDITAGDFKSIAPGKTRDSHTYLYMTPKWHGLQASASTIDFKEIEKDKGLYHNTGQSYNITYNTTGLLAVNDSFYAGVARNVNVQDTSITRYATQYKLGKVTVGALYQDSDKTSPGKVYYATGENSTNAVLTNASYDLTPNDTVKVQWGKSQAVEDDGVLVAYGYDHKINKNLKVFAFHTRVDGNYYDSASPAKQSDRTLMSNGVGAEYNF